MVCDLCGRPEESHPCMADLTKVLSENKKLNLKVDEFRKLLQQWMEASNLAQDITFAPIYKRTEFSLSTEEKPAPWTNEQKAALAEVADAIQRTVEKQNS